MQPSPVGGVTELSGRPLPELPSSPAVEPSESDDIQPTRKALAQRICEIAFGRNVSGRIETGYGGRGNHPRPDIAQQINPQHDVHCENNGEVAREDGGRHREISSNAHCEASKTAGSG